MCVPMSQCVYRDCVPPSPSDVLPLELYGLSCQWIVFTGRFVGGGVAVWRCLQACPLERLRAC